MRLHVQNDGYALVTLTHELPYIERAGSWQLRNPSLVLDLLSMDCAFVSLNECRIDKRFRASFPE